MGIPLALTKTPAFCPSPTASTTLTKTRKKGERKGDKESLLALLTGALAPFETPPKNLPLWRGTLILKTSGSMGEPKSVLLPAKRLFLAALSALPLLQMDGDSRALLTLPPQRIGGLMSILRTLVAGGTLLLSSPKTAHDDLETFSASHASMVLPQLVALFEDQRHLPHLRSLLLGGSSFPESLLFSVSKAYPKTRFTLGYGTSETLAFAYHTTYQYPNRTAAALPLRAIGLSSEGEVLVGGILSAGYLKEGAYQALPKDSAGFFKSGDKGTIDESGQIHIEGRLDRLFKSGGHKIIPQSLERQLKEYLPSPFCHCFLCILPKSDPKWGALPTLIMDIGETARRDTSFEALLSALKGFNETQASFTKIRRFVHYHDLVALMPSLPPRLFGKIPFHALVRLLDGEGASAALKHIH